MSQAAELRRSTPASLRQSEHVKAADLARRPTPWWLALIVTIFIFLLGAVLARISINVPPSASALDTALLWIPTLIVAYGIRSLLIWLWVSRYEGRTFRSLGFPRHGLLKLLRGMAIGLGIASAMVGISAMFGSVSIRVAPAGTAGVAAVGGALVMLAGWFVQSSTEEIMYRGFLLQSFARYRVWLGIVVSSVLFVVAHQSALGNPLAAFNIFLAAVMFCLLALREGGLWGACGLHVMFNWSQNSLFGFAVSGEAIPGGSLFALQLRDNDIVGGGAFGVEAGLAGTVVLLAVIVVLFLLRNKPAGAPSLPPKATPR